MVDYVETPWDPLVAVHWASPPAPNCHDNPDQVPLAAVCSCNSYGMGAIQTDFGGGSVGAAPYGSLILPPFAGTYNTVGLMGPLCDGEEWGYGGLSHPYVDGDGNLIASTYTPGNGSAVTNELLLEASQISFVTDAAASGSWHVPMCQGSKCVNLRRGRFDVDGNGRRLVEWSPVPVVVKRYTIEMQWDSPNYAWDGIGDPNDALSSVGVAFSHGFEQAVTNGPILYPPESAVTTIGDATGGSATLTYDFNYCKYIDLSASQLWPGADIYDMSAGGPILLWWLYRSVNGAAAGRPDGGWTSVPSAIDGSAAFALLFMDAAREPDFAHPENSIGHWYTWKITTTTETLCYGSPSTPDTVGCDR